MQILHGTWIPETTDRFIQSGGFYLWVETAEVKKQRRKASNLHPWQLAGGELATFLTEQLGVKAPSRNGLADAIVPKYFLLPTTGEQPLPSLELARYLEVDLPETFDWRFWQVDCCPALTAVKTGSFHYQTINNVVRLLNDLHFTALHGLVEIQLGADLLFWYHYTQAFKQIILNDHYIPALQYRALTPSTGKGRSSKKPQQPSFEIYPAWEIISDQYEADLQHYAQYMPTVCTAGFNTPNDSPKLYDRETLLRHFSESLLTEIVTHVPSSQAFEKKISDSVLFGCLNPQRSGMPWMTQTALQQYQHWQLWRDRIARSQTATPFHLYFQLQAPAQAEEAWELQFQVAPKADPSLRLPLLEYWRSRPAKQKQLRKPLGEDFEQQLLLNLGYAARVYPQLWTGLETDQPGGIFLTLERAFDFLKESAWVLEAAGYKVIVPAWWTPQGQQRAKVRLRARCQKRAASSNQQKSYFSFETLVNYEYELAIGDQSVSDAEWQQLVNAKTPLVQFRGEWFELDPDKMQQMLTFWQTQQQENPAIGLLDFMKLSAEAGEDLELDFQRDQTLAEMMAKLKDNSALEPMPDPAGLRGTLRDYQRRGVAWLHYLESLQLNGCLADDMGLGKTVQVIARLVQEREQVQQNGGSALSPTLLIAPTSVVGNWQKEIEKFAPHLQTLIHHGAQRDTEQKGFQRACQQCDVVITSFTLVRKDIKLLTGVDWHRIVLDEAQNIKNPKAAQTKAVLKLEAPHRLAMTGTPVENRLLDLWSIFNFLNPGYLGKEKQFRQEFEVPIQKNNDPTQAAVLKRLVEPFILRRVKTDQAIIKDLPEKVEQKLYCNLTQEQASLYEALVKDIEKQLQAAGGMQRKGLILASLLKLKQICNHPRQFLQDGSDFTPERSHKLSRLGEMVEEVMAEGESLLVFTQFTNIGEALQKYFKLSLRANTYYLHGGTNRRKREQMITAFQNPETEPSVFILSLKAGGVGITLTKANHVFHFDRWWNPAVEDQATDRAFRIGQQKNVFVHKFVAIGTLEERIDQMIEDKKKLAGSIVGTDESWLTELDNETFRQLITLNKSAILE